MNHVEVEVYDDLDQLSLAAADAFTQLADKVIHQRGDFKVVLSGGSTPSRLYQLLASPAYKSRISWPSVLFFWGDERLVPPDDEGSNYGQAKDLLLRHVDINPKNVFRMRGELDAGLAAKEYAQRLLALAGDQFAWPSFDLVLLGLGEDGHIASIFPGSAVEADSEVAVNTIVGEYQNRPSERLSLTPAVFNSSRNVWFLVSGESKAQVLAQVLQGEGSAAELPALRIKPERGKIKWLVDRDASSQLKSGNSIKGN